MLYSVVFLFFIATGISALEFLPVNETCLQIDAKQQNTYLEAKELCKKRGLVLHSVQNDNEMNAMKPHLKEAGNYWVNVYEVNGVFKWGDGRICCPKTWWGPAEPETGEKCARLWYGNGQLHLYGRTCNLHYGLICSKPKSKVWSLINSTDYNFLDLCGIEIMPNCGGLLCHEVCEFHPNCDQVATMSNVCVNIKDLSQTDKCVIKITPTMGLYRKVLKCV